jgi:hypothetical protein
MWGKRGSTETWREQCVFDHGLKLNGSLISCNSHDAPFRCELIKVHEFGLFSGGKAAVVQAA